MNFTVMTRVSLLCTLVFSFIINVANAQSIPADIGSLSDAQLTQYLEQVKSKGFTIEQIKTLAIAKGVSTTQIAEFERRVSTLSAGSSSLEGAQIDTSLEVSNAVPLGNTGNNSDQIIDSNIFGLNFFNNRNITFTPNLNVATPDTYILGPGDEIAINIWGAAENNYLVTVDREGVLRIPNLGPVFVNGMSIREANTLIISKLKRIYGGINASPNSPYKVFVNTSLSQVRSVQIDITGEVKVPGTYTLNSLSTVLNALYAAGGPTEEGTFREIKLIRNGQVPVYFDIYKYLIEGSQEGNITLRDQDLIIVSQYQSRVTISGAVKTPGVFELKNNEDFGDLLKYTSGFKDNAYKAKIALERIEGDGRVLKEIDFKTMLNARLMPGDKLSVKTISDRIKNKISIAGAIYRGGDYEYIPGITLKEFIAKASGIKEAAFMERGIIYRDNLDLSKSIVAFSLKNILNGSENIVLQENDNVRLFDKNSLENKYNVSISGGVRSPGSFDYFDGMTIADVVLTAGGFSDKANENIIDVYRKINDDKFETLTETFRITLDRDLNISPDSNFILVPGDRISVRLLKGVNDGVVVSVSGEVNHPGNYSSQTKNERISDFIAKAGGLSPYAFTDGATLIRINPFYNEDGQNITTNTINENTADQLQLNNKKEFRVGINLKEIMKGNGSKGDMILKDGDRLIIPSIKETVKTEGEVLVPSLIRHEKGLGFKEYINKSGGFGNDAIRRKTYVIYPNGEIASTKNFLFFKAYPKVKPGSLVIVPKKVKNPNPVSVQEVLGITSGFATLALLVDRVFSN